MYALAMGDAMRTVRSRMSVIRKLALFFEVVAATRYARR